MATHVKSKADEQPASFRAEYFTVIGGNTKRFFQMAIFSPKKVRSDTFIGIFLKVLFMVRVPWLYGEVISILSVSEVEENESIVLRKASGFTPYCVS